MAPPSGGPGASRAQACPVREMLLHHAPQGRGRTRRHAVPVWELGPSALSQGGQGLQGTEEQTRSHTGPGSGPGTEAKLQRQDVLVTDMAWGRHRGAEHAVTSYCSAAGLGPQRGLLRPQPLATVPTHVSLPPNRGSQQGFSEEARHGKPLRTWLLSLLLQFKNRVYVKDYLWRFCSE